jgi:hypothetical protein
MRLRLCALTAVAAIGVAALPSLAGVPKAQITDPVGDANGINQQFPGVGPEPPDASTAPADLSSADIVSVTFQNTFVTKVVKHKPVKTPNGFTVTMQLAAAPTPNIEYRVSGAAAGCTSVFFEYDTSVGTGGADIRCPATPPATNTTYDGTAAVSGSKIVWTVPASSFRTGTTFSSLDAQTRTVAVEVTAPQVDYATSSATFTVGK